MNLEPLLSIGLTEGEAKVFAAVAKKPLSTITTIVKEAGVSSGKIYLILDKLAKLGLVRHVLKNKIKHFSAVSQNKVVELLDAKEKEISKQKKQVVNLFSSHLEQSQDAFIYEGYGGVQAAQEFILETLSNKDEYYVFSFSEMLTDKRVARLLQNYHKKRVEKNISVKILAQDTHKDILKKWKKSKGMQIKLTSSTIPIGTTVFKDHIMLTVWGDYPSAFIIKSSQVYQRYKKVFEELWKSETVL